MLYSINWIFVTVLFSGSFLEKERNVAVGSKVSMLHLAGIGQEQDAEAGHYLKLLCLEGLKMSCFGATWW